MSKACHTGERWQIVSGRVINKAAVLRAHENVVRKVDIGAGPVDECRARLRARTVEVAGVEDQRASASQSEGRHFVERHAEDIRAGNVVGVRFHANCARGRAIALRVQRVTVTGLDAVVGATGVEGQARPAEAPP